MSGATGRLSLVKYLCKLENPGSDPHRPHKKAGNAASSGILAQQKQRPWTRWASSLSFLNSNLEGD